MKKLELEKIGVQEMNIKQMKKINGGFMVWAAIAVGIAIAAAAEIFGDWDNFKAGLFGKCEH